MTTTLKDVLMPLITKESKTADILKALAAFIKTSKAEPGDALLALLEIARLNLGAVPLAAFEYVLVLDCECVTVQGTLDDEPVSVLELACEAGRGDVAGLLLQAGAELPDDVEGGLVDTLLESLETRFPPWGGEGLEDVDGVHVDGLCVLLEAGEEPGEQAVFRALTAYRGAARVRAVRALIAADADVHEENPDGLCVLADVCQYYKQADEHLLELIKVLIEAGAIKDGEDGGLDSVEALISRGPDAVDVLRTVLDAGADVTGEVAGEDKGETACEMWTLASRHGDAKVAQVLVDAGLSLKERDADGRTPLMAVFQRHPHTPKLEVLECMVENGADVTAVDDDGKNVLMHACAVGVKAGPLRALLKLGADATLLDEAGYSVVDKYVAKCTKPVVEALLKAGCPLRKKNGQFVALKGGKKRAWMAPLLEKWAN